MADLAVPLRARSPTRVIDAADAPRADGHDVLVVDMYDGRIFGYYDGPVSSPRRSATRG